MMMMICFNRDEEKRGAWGLGVAMRRGMEVEQGKTLQGKTKQDNVVYC